ncbi:glycosyltransferase family 1 protein [Rhodococcus aerolatus]
MIPPHPRLAGLPDDHPYVAAVRPTSVDRVRVPVDGPHPWSPSRLWDPAEVAARAGGLDVVHVHFGYDHLGPAALQAWTAALAAAGVALVVTVHDLRNPHHDDRAAHDDALAVLVGAAAAVTTLTPGAAAEVAARFGRTPVVLPHPSLTSWRPDGPGEAGLVGVDLKSLRRNLLRPVEVAAAVAAGAHRAGGRARVSLHRDAAGTDVGRALAALDGVELVVHERRDDAALDRHLAGLHVSVLPHAFGTHSGWLEQCRDLGTRVVAPSCGYYAQQWDDVLTYTQDEDHGLDPDSLADAVARALATPPPAPADPAWRAAQRDDVRAAHAAIYAAVAAP